MLDTGHPIRVPVGRAILGRMFNVLGQPIDGRPAPKGTEWRPIHAASPPLREQRVVVEPFVTGIKAIDLLPPHLRGGKIGLFGGARVGKTIPYPLKSPNPLQVCAICLFLLSFTPSSIEYQALNIWDGK